MKRLYLHIGHYKTGTSAIQKYCSEHAPMLAAQGYLYPAAVRGGGNGTNHGALSLTLAARHGFTPPPWYTGSRDIDKVYAAFLKEARRAEQDNILISSEEFFQLALRRAATEAIADLKSRLSEFDTRIVLYIREPMALLKSWYNEVNKGPFGTRPFPAFFKHLDANFLSQVGVYRKFADAFGPERMIVRTYRHTGMDHIRQFLAAVDHAGEVEEADIRTQKAQDLKLLELNRLAKKHRHSKDEATLSRVGRLDLLHRKVARINEDFARLARLSDMAVESQLSLSNIFLHHHDLLAPVVAAGKARDEEATVLRNTALNAEKLDLDLALVVMRTAALIRPRGAFIQRKIRQYETTRAPDREQGAAKPAANDSTAPEAS